MKLIIANWKATKTRTEVLNWWNTFSQGQFTQKAIDVVICPPSPYLFLLYDLLKNKSFPFPISVGAQDISRYPGGRYTGEVTAAMLQGVITHVFLGHSERRRWLGETSQDVAEKARRALDHDMTPLVLFSRENCREQLTQFDDTELRDIVLMYEPPEAISELSGPIGKGQSAALEDVEDMVNTVKTLAPESKITYGGSVKRSNVRSFLDLASLNGVGVGSASMDAQEFVNILNTA